MKEVKKENQEQPVGSQYENTGRQHGTDEANGETARSRGETNNNSYTDEYDNYCPWS